MIPDKITALTHYRSVILSMDSYPPLSTSRSPNFLFLTYSPLPLH